MSYDEKILHLISNETKKSIDQISVVTPSIFASIFTEFANKHDTKIENEEDIAAGVLQQECSALTTMQSQTSKDAQHLSQSANKAIEAIKAKDESTLNEVLKETQKLRAEIEKLKESVYKDELTNVYNRKWLHDNYLDEASDNFSESGILAMIDLNYFKIVNDTHGHVIGDKVLIFIANELRKSKYNVIRYGGDEFIVLFPKNTLLNDAKEVLNEIREKIITTKLKAHKTIFRTSFSIGLQQYEAQESLADILEMADKDMYHDKLEIKKRITGIEI